MVCPELTGMHKGGMTPTLTFQYIAKDLKQLNQNHKYKNINEQLIRKI